MFVFAIHTAYKSITAPSSVVRSITFSSSANSTDVLSSVLAQPWNVNPAFSNVFAGRSFAIPYVIARSSISPLPVFAWNLIVYVCTLQLAYNVVPLVSIQFPLSSVYPSTLACSVPSVPITTSPVFNPVVQPRKVCPVLSGLSISTLNVGLSYVATTLFVPSVVALFCSNIIVYSFAFQPAVNVTFPYVSTGTVITPVLIVGSVVECSVSVHDTLQPVNSYPSFVGSAIVNAFSLIDVSYDRGFEAPF